MFEKLIQRYQVAREKRRNLRETTRQLDENIKTVKQLAQAYDEDITRIRKELDQEAHAATTRKTLDQAWRNAIKNRDEALDALITELNRLRNTYEAYQDQGGPERYEVEDLLDAKQYQYSSNVCGLVDEVELIGQIVANMRRIAID